MQTRNLSFVITFILMILCFLQSPWLPSGRSEPAESDGPIMVGTSQTPCPGKTKYLGPTLGKCELPEGDPHRGARDCELKRKQLDVKPNIMQQILGIRGVPNGFTINIPDGCEKDTTYKTGCPSRQEHTVDTTSSAATPGLIEVPTPCPFIQEGGCSNGNEQRLREYWRNNPPTTLARDVLNQVINLLGALADTVVRPCTPRHPEYERWCPDKATAPTAANSYKSVVLCGQRR